jgi:hypothetical protein
VTNHPARTRRSSPLRTSIRRAAALFLLVPALLVTSLTGIASADAPVQWDDNGPYSPLYVITILVVIPVGMFALITLLVYLPSMMRKGESYHPGQPWRNESEWFGGPRGGVGAVDSTEQPLAASGSDRSKERGGASGRW